MLTIDIGSDKDECGKKLSNFTAFSFIIDGVECASMEGFLQSLKFEDIQKQIEVCKLVGLKAKFKGKKKKWYKEQFLYWQGQTYQRESKAYQDLLDLAFSELFKNKSFASILNQTKGKNLTHNIGKENPKETVLTTYEFCDRLMKLRDY